MAYVRPVVCTSIIPLNCQNVECGRKIPRSRLLGRRASRYCSDKCNTRSRNLSGRHRRLAYQKKLGYSGLSEAVKQSHKRTHRRLDSEFLWRYRKWRDMKIHEALPLYLILRYLGCKNLDRKLLYITYTPEFILLNLKQGRDRCLKEFHPFKRNWKTRKYKEKYKITQHQLEVICSKISSAYRKGIFLVESRLVNHHGIQDAN